MIRKKKRGKKENTWETNRIVKLTQNGWYLTEFWCTLAVFSISIKHSYRGYMFAENWGNCGISIKIIEALTKPPGYRMVVIPLLSH